MQIFVFGNPDHPQDNKALQVTKLIKASFPNIIFSHLDPNDQFDQLDLHDELIILDTAVGIRSVVEFTDMNKITNQPSTTMHDFDIGFQLKCLKKLGKIKRVRVIAIPVDMKIETAAKKVKAILQTIQPQEN